MGRTGKELTLEVKQIAQKLFEEGKTIDFVSNTLNVLRSTVGSLKKRIEQRDSIVNIPKSGRKPTVTAREYRRLESPLLSFLIDTYAWKGTLLLLSAIILNCIPCALIFRSLPVQNCANRSQETVHGESEENKISFVNPKDSHCTGENTAGENKCNIKFGSKDRQEGQEHGVYPTDSVRIEIVRQDASRIFEKGIQPIDCSKDSKFSKDSNEVIGSTQDSVVERYKTLFQCTEVVVFFFTQFLFFAGFYIPFIYIPDKATGDGITLSLTSVVLVDITGINLFADAMGFNNLFSAFGSILGPPITGLLYDVTQTYTSSFLAAGLAMTISGILLVLVSFCRKQK
ncbi:monocarboxylate transporter 5-like [Ruditapes philippinarum]|uniref:monocarboxylate transporter 5-like n=1 Tax=Ruditapes philippinarum TaxID=129788 RepID=UPI00295B426E|nr:monocarboxylate transporter 5-like [Ruditapes philippinarum]